MPKPLSAASAAKVAKGLSAWFSQTGKRGLGARTQIIDPRLCTDLLRRLGPSLEKHKGCDLIDVNPGIGLWSEYLHEHLQPRRHILLEPDRDFFDPYLQPFVARHPERVTLTDKSLKEVIHNEDLLGENAAPRDELQRMTTVNDKILLTINVAGHVGARNSVVGRQDKYLWNNIYSSFMGIRDDLWDRGLFRVLTWLPDEHKFLVMPRSAHDILRQSIDMETAASVTEAASASATRLDRVAHPERIFDIEMEDARMLKKSDTDESVMDIRTDFLPRPPTVHVLPEVSTLKSTELADRPNWVDRLFELDDHVQQTHPAIYDKAAPQWKHLGRRAPTIALKSADPEVKEWCKLYSRARTEHGQYLSVLKVAHDQRALENEWRANNDNSHTVIAAFKQRASAIVAAREKLRARDQQNVLKVIDDYRLLDNRSTHWYRRTADPLLVHPREFAHEESPLALLDIRPNPEFRAKFDTQLKLSCLDHVLAQMIHKSSQDVYSSLDQNLVSGGVDEFLQTVPNLTDIKKGGWYDLRELRVRTLPPWLWEDIALAYEAWPFRASFEAMSFGPQSRNLGPYLKSNAT